MRLPGSRGRSSHHVLGRRGARQARSPGRQGCQAGEAGQAVLCWGSGVPVRQEGEAARQARPVRPSCAGRAGCQAGKVAKQARPPGRRG